MVWVIVLLAVMNIATIVTIIYNRNHNVSRLAPDTRIPQESSSLRYSGRYFRDYLGFNNEQMEKFAGFNPVFRQGVRSINSQLNNIRHQMLIAMDMKNVDTERLDMLSDSIGNLHAELKKLTYRYYLDMKEICNEQQKEKLGQLFGDMFAGEGRLGQYGKGGPQGKGRGRRFNN